MADAPLSFSVAVPTMGRTDELAALLQSIGDSTVRPAQIIVVDQNADDRLARIIAQFSSLGINHHRVTFRGLSAAKNYAAKVASSDVLFTPDDDCRVLANTFQTALEELARTGADVVFGKCLDENGADSLIRYRRRWRLRRSARCFLA
jgi:glycosyltransferase involved in cell wall biosynthesis